SSRSASQSRRITARTSLRSSSSSAPNSNRFSCTWIALRMYSLAGFLPGRGLGSAAARTRLVLRVIIEVLPVLVDMVRLLLLSVVGLLVVQQQVVEPVADPF